MFPWLCFGEDANSSGWVQSRSDYFFRKLVYFKFQCWGFFFLILLKGCHKGIACRW